MARVTTSISRNKKYNQVKLDYSSDAKRIVGQATDLVRNDVLKSLHGGFKGGITYTKYNPNRIHTASAPGEAPATDTGFLASNIYKDIEDNGMTGIVESRAPYSAALEFGTSKILPRPFMQPALEKNRNKIKRLFNRGFKA